LNSHENNNHCSNSLNTVNFLKKEKGNFAGISPDCFGSNPSYPTILADGVSVFGIFWKT
jgi:hypothetical protein